MRRRIEHRTGATPDRVRSVVADLGTYADWLSIVDRAESAPGHADDPGPAWFVTLRARLGRFSRAKRLRMVRVETGDARVVFERHERDGRQHSAWVLTADVEPAADGTDVTFELAYDGGLLEPVVSRLLDGEIEASRPRLDAVLTGG